MDAQIDISQMKQFKLKSFFLHLTGFVLPFCVFNRQKV